MSSGLWCFDTDCMNIYQLFENLCLQYKCKPTGIKPAWETGCMQISHEASFGARVRETVNGAHRILPLSVSVQGQRCRLVVGRLEHELPPYRIENRCHPGTLLAQITYSERGTR